MGTLFNANNESFTPDAIITESYSEPALVTDYPVALDSNASDHRQPLPRTLSLVFIVTETPFEGTLNELDDSAIEADSLINGPRAWQALRYTRDSAALGLFSYYSTRLGLLENLSCEDISYRVENRLSMMVTVELKQVLLSETRRVDLPPLVVRKKQPALCPKVEQGDQSKKEVDPKSDDSRDIGLLRNGLSGLQSDGEIAAGFSNLFEL